MRLGNRVAGWVGDAADRIAGAALAGLAVWLLIARIAG